MIKVVSWNMQHRASSWNALLQSNADLALLQEASKPPDASLAQLRVDDAPWRTEGAGMKRPWRTAVVALSSRVKVDWLEPREIAAAKPQELAVSRLGTLAAAHVTNLESGESVTVASLYGAWENPALGHEE